MKRLSSAIPTSSANVNHVYAIVIERTYYNHDRLKVPRGGMPMDYIGADGGVTDGEKEFTYSRHQEFTHCGFKRTLFVLHKRFFMSASVCG